MNEHGAGMLEVLVAITVAAVVGAGTARSLAGLAATAEAVREADRNLTLARNLLVAELAAPCAPYARCPADATCSVSRTIVAGAPGARAVHRIDVRAGAAARLTGIAPAPSSECEP